MPSILIVDDDALTAKAYADFLRRGGYQVAIAANASTALVQMESQPPDGMLVDLLMPGINGIELLKTIRSKTPFQNIPIFAFTTAFVPHFIEQARAAGATDIFDKAKLTGPLLQNAFQQHLR